jgi:hypothetical protein
MSGKLSQWIKGLAIVAGTFITASTAHAGLTSVGRTGKGEAGAEQVFENQFGGAWHKVGDDFYNGAMSAKRMDDYMTVPGVLDIAKGDCGMSTDQKWCGNTFTVTAVAKFSDYSQSLGIVDSDGHSHSLFDVNGYGFNIDPESKTLDMNGQQFTWTRSGNSGMQSSLDSLNGDSRDHMLTYIVNGLPGVSGPVWMLFFEDLNKTASIATSRTYADYNDLVVEVRPAMNPVPLPPADLAGLITLSGLVLYRSRKHILSFVTA